MLLNLVLDLLTVTSVLFNNALTKQFKFDPVDIKSLQLHHNG
jgi:hypothetical protein